MNKIKSFIILFLCSMLMSSCIIKPLKKLFFSSSGEEEEQLVKEPEKSKAKESKWDFYFVGSWRYSTLNTEKSGDYKEGIETFLGDGSYSNLTFTSDGKKAVVKGRWKLDDKEDYVVWVDQECVVTDQGKKTVNTKVKYIVMSLDPGVELLYLVDGVTRKSQWVAGKSDAATSEEEASDTEQ